MAEKLKTPTPTTQVEKEQCKVPTLDTITGLMTSQYPKQNLPSAEICAKIGNIFSNLSAANKAYSEAAEGLAELSTEISPEHFTLILTAATAPVIQIVVPQGMISLVVAQAPPPPSEATPLGRKSIIDYTKTKVLPNPDSPALHECNKNTATRVLAVAIFSTLERKFFDQTQSRVEIATAFRCNTSQLSKALTGIEYASGPHHYKAKRQTGKRQREEKGESGEATPSKRQKATSKTSDTTMFKLRHTGDPNKSILDDTLASESSSSDLPPGL